MATQVKHRRGTQSEIDAFTGAIGEIVVNTTEEELVLNNGATQGGIPIAKKRNTVLSFDTLADAVSNTALKVGYTVNLKERTSGNGGGAQWVVVLASSVTPNTYNIVQCTGAPSLALSLTIGKEIIIEQWGCVPDYDTSDQSGTDNLPVLQAIKSYIDGLPIGSGWVSGDQESEGFKVSSSAGTFGLSGTMDWGTTSVNLEFAGMFQTVFAALSGFSSGTPIFRLGSKLSQILTRQISLSKCSFNCAAINNVIGFDFYGLRDGSSLRDIFVSGFTGTAVYSDFAGESGGAFMSEGVIIDNVQALSFVHSSGDIFSFGGLFECTILGGKALLNSLSRAGSATGYRIGRTECQGVNLQGVSVGNLRGTGQKIGILYDNANECWDNECTFENIGDNSIRGFDVYFGLNDTCSICKSVNGRHYNPAAINELPYRFLNANTCSAVKKNQSASSKAAVFEASAVNCSVLIELVNGDIQAIKSNVIEFVAGSSGCNANGYSSVDGAYWGLTGDNLSSQVGANGTQLKHDQFWTSFELGDQNKMRVRDNLGNLLMTINGTNGEVTIETNLIKMGNLPATIATAGYLFDDGSGTLKIAQ